MELNEGVNIHYHLKPDHFSDPKLNTIVFYIKYIKP